MDDKTCEDRYDGPVCGRRAIALVQVGTRKFDAQWSCGLHLARTCRVMAYGDNGIGERPKVLTVTMFGTT